MGDNYWPYNVNENVKALEAITQYGHEQGLSLTRIDYKTFFHAEAAAVAGY